MDQQKLRPEVLLKISQNIVVNTEIIKTDLVEKRIYIY
jgi:hypothetical protein